MKTAKPDVLIPFFDFSKTPAGDPDASALQDLFKLRYEVYCIERGFVDLCDCRDGMERDEYDRHSVHFAARNHDRMVVGTIRLVDSTAERPFPFERRCPVFQDYVFPPREQAREISRLVVRKTYRRRSNDTSDAIVKSVVDRAHGIFVQPRPGTKRRNGDSPRLLLGLYREMYRHSRQAGVRFWFAAMDRSLARSLEKMGFSFIAIGPPCDYYDLVTPFVVDIDQLNSSLKESDRFLHAWFNDLPISRWLLLSAWVKFHLAHIRKRI